MKSRNRISVDNINDRMALRSPQQKSLEILDWVMTSLDLIAPQKELESAIHQQYPIFREFERNFPSLTFALATGVGKTRLMGAFIFYLWQNYGIKNYFIVAPNLTIYEKLKRDFGDPSYEKYVFGGLQQFAQTPPRIITGENYRDTIPNQTSSFKGININIFNIGKINIENKGGAESHFRRLAEYIGQSYFNYLKSLPDLVMLMDESHHYRADAGFKVLNDLEPFLGLELTATPQVEASKGAVKFRNVVYEYSLAQAIGNFVKTPWVATKKDFNPRLMDAFAVDKIKLTDGIIVHRNTAAELLAYAENKDERIVKPFVLVVCKDTSHAEEIMQYIKSEDFFDGYYADKVIEVHSNQRGAEKDENIRLLLNLESPDNKIEIVVHVNMLKEGWDVTNLYTIIPLRVAASLTLREQTIGRGLRLPYGKITGCAAVDRLTIVAHDKFDEIVRAASDENSIIRKDHIIEIENDEDYGKEKETVKAGTQFDEHIKTLERQKGFARSEEKKKEIDEQIKATRYVGQAIEEITTNVVNISIQLADGDKDGEAVAAVPSKTLNFIPRKKDLARPEVQQLVMQKAVEIARREREGERQLSIFDDQESEAMSKVIAHVIAPVIEEKIKSSIDIPNIAIVAVGAGQTIIRDFDLDTTYLFGFSVPSDEIIMENLQNEESQVIVSGSEIALDEPPQHYILGEVLEQNSLVDYAENADLLNKLVSQMLVYIKDGKSERDFIRTLFAYKKEIAKAISEQILDHATVTPPEYEMRILQTSTAIRTESYTKFKEDEVERFTKVVPAYLIKKTVFGGFSKSCTDVCKFDSVPEHDFAVALERETSVEKWLRPAMGQLPITYASGSSYQPDFIVETDKAICIIEVKRADETDDDTVRLKAFAAEEYCRRVNVAFGTTTKPWHYYLIPDTHIKRTFDFDTMLARAVRLR
jgi:type III restriction enzyme